MSVVSSDSLNIEQESKEERSKKLSLTFPPAPDVKPTDGMVVDHFYLVRGGVVPVIARGDLFAHGLQLDSDVYRYTAQGRIEDKPSLSNRHRFVTNDSFKSTAEIEAYLRSWGKIPSFLELKPVPGKGNGIFTKTDIPHLNFLGYYEGVYRPLGKKFVENVYDFIVHNFDAKPCSLIDAENLTFSNWTRFINDGASPNIEFAVYNCQIYVFAARDIKAGEELIGSYGEGYWKAMEAKGIKRLQ
jgi:hypothetical protein